MCGFIINNYAPAPTSEELFLYVFSPYILKSFTHVRSTLP